MLEHINSLQNQYVKQAASLREKKYREETGLFAVEGIRLVEEAAQSDYCIDLCLCTEKVAQSERGQAILAVLGQKKIRLLEVSESVYAKISDTEQPQGIMALVQKQRFCLREVAARQETPFWVVLDHLQDPGNVGAAIRSADAAGCTAVILSPGCADPFAGKTVRASMGSLFHLPILEQVALPDFFRLCKETGVTLLASSLASSDVYFEVDFTPAVAVIFGNEGNGVSQESLAAADQNVYIPLLGKAESLNVSAAVSVILYEAVRQRHYGQRREKIADKGLAVGLGTID